MKLASRLFISHLVTVFVSVVLVALLTATVVPVALVTVSEYHIIDLGQDSILRTETITAHRNPVDYFRVVMNKGLLISGVISTLVAIVLSWYMSRRIIRPLHEIAHASQRIASGLYEQRLTVGGHDELANVADSFNRMAQSLAHVEQTRRQLLADVSHELKTPLASIKGYMEGLEDGIIAPSPETFHLIYREADRLQRLVNDLHEISRLESDSIKLDIHAINPVHLVRDVVAYLRPQYEEKNVKLQAVLPETLPEIVGDEDRLRQVLTNLIGNALQFTPEAGCVTVRLQPQEQFLCFSIEDTGIGLRSDDIERVFQRFYRVDRSRARSRGGSGIGLTIARHFVERHHGKIWAESAGLGQGSRFYFTLPTYKRENSPVKRSFPSLLN